MFKYLSVIIFIFLALLYYFMPLGVSAEFSQIFLTIATFLFAIFAGFFISRQGQRYSDIRNQISEFDGEMSSLYRQFGHLGKESQEKMKGVIQNHYYLILENKAWDYHFTHKSSTLTLTHQLAEETTKDQMLSSLKSLALERILSALRSLQVVRKKMVALHTERIPNFQWATLALLATILLITVSIIPSFHNILGSVLKGAFSSSIIFVLILLHQFDNLKFFEGTMGEHSAQDILDIFTGKR